MAKTWIYNNHEYEDFLKEEAEIRLIVHKRKVSKRPLREEVKYIQGRMRKGAVERNSF